MLRGRRWGPCSPRTCTTTRRRSHGDRLPRTAGGSSGSGGADPEGWARMGMVLAVVGTYFFALAAALALLLLPLPPDAHYGAAARSGARSIDARRGAPALPELPSRA